MATTKKVAASKGGAKQGGAKKTSRCWPGYEPTPGKKPGAKGSCRPKKT